eukprot:9467219-Pyramimonas_sp.AAC.1
MSLNTGLPTIPKFVKQCGAPSGDNRMAISSPAFISRSRGQLICNPNSSVAKESPTHENITATSESHTQRISSLIKQGMKASSCDGFSQQPRAENPIRAPSECHPVREDTLASTSPYSRPEGATRSGINKQVDGTRFTAKNEESY